MEISALLKKSRALHSTLYNSRMAASLPKKALGRFLLFFLASNAAVLFVFNFGRLTWPEGLPAFSQNAFWLPSGVNLVGILLLGPRYWPAMALNAFPAWLLGGEPLEIGIPGSLTNVLEALLAAWMVRRLGKFDGRFDTVRAVGALLLASLGAPLINTLIIPAWRCARGLMPWSVYPEALGNWNLANAASMLVVAPLLVATLRGGWTHPARWKELAIFFAATAVISLVTFGALFSGSGFNITFLVFPAVIYAAARFGPGETAATLGITLAAVLVSLATHAHAIPPAKMAEAIWFAQAFCWVLAATGLLGAALVSERHRARDETRAERERALEISLSEERARLEALRYQLSPHFLFNSLNSIYSTLPVADAEIPRRMLTDLSGYLRSTLAGRERDLLPLRDELRSMEQYLAIERHRFGDDLQTEIRADAAALGVEVPAFLLQPLVENAIVHGFAATRDLFHLQISAVARSGTLRIEVANTGAWKPDRAEGVGITNTRRRLEMLYGGRAAFAVGYADGWVRAKIELPTADGQ